MIVHFYATIERIKSIHQGHEGYVVTKESKGKGMVQVSFDLDIYDITQTVGSPYAYTVKKK